MDNNTAELFEDLFRLGWLLRRHRMMNHRGRGPMASSPFQGQGRVLALLKLKPEISQKELSTILAIRSQSLGEVLAKLERQGYITRSPSEEDKRGMKISLTEAGRAASEEQEEKADTESLLACLSEEEQAAFKDYLGRLIKSLEERLAAEGGAGGEGGFPEGFDPREGGFDPRSHGFDPRGGFPGRREGRPPFDGRGFGRPPRDGD